MIELLIIACLSSSPDQCRPHVVPTPGSNLECMMSALQSVAQWAGDHPGWTIKRIECREYGEDV